MTGEKISYWAKAYFNEHGTSGYSVDIEGVDPKDAAKNFILYRTLDMKEIAKIEIKNKSSDKSLVAEFTGKELSDLFENLQ